MRASLIGDVAVYQVSGHRVTLPSGTSCVREYHLLKLNTCTAVEKQYKTRDRSVSETRTPIPVWSRTVLSTKTLLSSSTSSQMNNLLRLYGRFTQPGYLLPSKKSKVKNKRKENSPSGSCLTSPLQWFGYFNPNPSPCFVTCHRFAAHRPNI